MVPGNWEQVQTIFAAAAELQGAERKQYLDESCAGRPELRAEVESLLASDSNDTRMISCAIEGTAINLLGHEPAIGRRLGAYRLIRELGRGGMGSVYLAVRDDDQYQKQVAIKLVRSDFDGSSLRGRFRSEMQILATLDHPHIARLLDGGTTADGLPYIVMEYVDGIPIDRYCRLHALNADRICELFCKVCEAVSYAHRNLVIHRDLKPGNILVTEDGNPKLLDFGIAKLLAPGPGAALATQTALQPLTPDYASPEQVRGNPVTTATDVYQLGTLLYELLTGQKPHRMQTYTAEEIARVICREDVERPSVAGGDGNTAVPRKRLAGDLDNIVLMALRKEPERRYPSAEQFREDVVRHLKALPVVAREDTIVYRTSRFVRRNRLAVAAAAMLFLTLAAGIVATDRERRQADLQRRKAEAEHRIADEQRDVAVRERRNAEAQAHEAQNQRQRAEQRMRQLLQLANKSLFDIHGAIATLPGATEARRQLVTTTLEYLDSLSKDDSLDFDLAHATADGYLFLAQIQGLPYRPNLGQPKEALVNLAKAEAILQRLKQQQPNNFALWMMSVGLYQTAGSIQEYTGGTGAALAQYTKALAAARKTEALAPGNPDALTQEAIMNHEFARVWSDTDPARAAPYARRETELYTRLVGAHVNEVELTNALGSSYLMLGRIAANQGRLDEALRNLRKAVEIREELQKKQPDNAILMRNLLVTYSRLADTLGAPFQDNNLGDTRQALEYYRKSLALSEKLTGHDPNDRLARTDLAMTLTRVGAALDRPAERAESLTLLRRAAKIYEEMPGGPKGVRDRANHAMTYEFIGHRQEPADPQAALASYRRSLQIAEEAAAGATADPGLHAQILADWRALAQVLASQGNRAGALAAADKSIALAEKTGPDRARHEIAKSQFVRGEVYEILARLQDGAAQQRVADWSAAKDAFEHGRELAEAPARIAECEQAIVSARAETSKITGSPAR
jgi:serine/threonine protein kinase/tetratricopeptide (TPR) repeat protein